MIFIVYILYVKCRNISSQKWRQLYLFMEKKVYLYFVKHKLTYLRSSLVDVSNLPDRNLQEHVICIYIIQVLSNSFLYRIFTAKFFDVFKPRKTSF
jgi:hypothetical protein